MGWAIPVSVSVAPCVESFKLLIVCVTSGLHLLSQCFSLLRYFKTCIWSWRLGAFLVRYFFAETLQTLIYLSLALAILHFSVSEPISSRYIALDICVAFISTHMMIAPPPIFICYLTSIFEFVRTTSLFY